MEFQFPGQASQEILSEGHGKSWKLNMLGNNEPATALISVAKLTSAHLAHYKAGEYMKR